jgi:N-acetylglucosamine-6-sulfatase
MLNRRQLACTFSLLPMLLIATSHTPASAASTSSTSSAASMRPNIVMILSDDLDDRISPFWERATSKGLDDPLKKTRALIVDKGVRFVNAFAPTPICCPARATLLTGLYGHNTGVLTNGGPYGGWQTFVTNGNEQKTVAVQLQAAGYKTGLLGKYLNGIENDPAHIPAGWSDWQAFVDNISYVGYGYTMNENGTMVKYGGPQERAPDGGDNYSTDVIARKAVGFLNQAKQTPDQPFFLYVAPTAPHLPLQPAPRHANNPYKGATSPQPPNFQEADVSDKSLWLKGNAELRAAEVAAWNPIDYRNRQGSLYALDELVESVINTLKQNGQLDNTYVIFTSDNGYNLGAHRLIHKMAPYEESIRVPLAIRGPGIPAGVKRPEMAAEIDFMPTVLDWAGVTPGSTLDGMSWKPLLGTSASSNWRTDLLLQYVENGVANGIGAEMPPSVPVILGQDIPTYRALRNQGYLYVEFTAPGTEQWHQYELYDLAKDPYELLNLLSLPGAGAKYASLIQTLQARMDMLTTCKGSTCH